MKSFLRRSRPGAAPHDQTWMIGNSTVRVGAYTYGHDHLLIREWGEGAGLTIGRFCSIADDIQIYLGGGHRTDWATTYPFGHIFTDAFGAAAPAGHPATRGDITIGNDVWIASGARLYSGVTVGDGAVIGGQAVVVRDVAPYEVVAGNPARHVRFRFAEDIVELLLELQWWTLPAAEIRSLVPVLCQAPDRGALETLIAKYRAPQG